MTPATGPGPTRPSCSARPTTGADAGAVRRLINLQQSGAGLGVGLTVPQLSQLGRTTNEGLKALKLNTGSSASLGTAPTGDRPSPLRRHRGLASKTYTIVKTDGAAAVYSTTTTDDAKWTEANTSPGAAATTPEWAGEAST